ncbi:MAG TPA: hypothetical protein VGF24_36395 [Vicinamibacterales bacterium]|jgi:hypothetical protein
MNSSIRQRQLIGSVAIALAVATAPCVWAQAQSSTPAASKTAGIPRTPWGDPDLQGTYTNSNESGIPMEKPAEFAGKRQEDVTPADLDRLIKQRAARQEKTAQTIGGSTENDTGAGPPHWYENYNAKNSRAWMVSEPEDGKIPATTDEAKKRAAAVRAARRGGDGYNTGPFDGPQDLTLYVRCITRGLPGSMMPAIYGNTYDITQGPGVVAIRYEMVHETRIIPLDPSTLREPQGRPEQGRGATGSGSPRAESRGDSRPHLSRALESYMGDARGHFEGDTLVVETTNVLEKSAYGGASDKIKIIERWRPTSANTIEWSISFDDPTTWVKPWTFGMRLSRDEGGHLFEYACHEGNEGLRGILSAARAAEREAGSSK